MTRDIDADAQHDAALRRLSALVDDLVARGVSGERIALLGFSQGACLTTEFAARNPRRVASTQAWTSRVISRSPWPAVSKWS